jgi:RNA polymerase sigma factor (TIGR02999 family)
MSQPAEVTELLRSWGRGEAGALDRLTPLVYAELHRMARRYMRNERSGNTLQTTALVNEAYLRLVDIKNAAWQDRAHFFALSAQMMRRILVDSARARASAKRGGYVNVLRDAMAVDVLEPCGVYFGTTGGQVYMSAESGDSWSPIVRDLPAVLSVEVQTLQ